MRSSRAKRRISGLQSAGLEWFCRVFLCLDDIRSVEIKFSRPEAVRNCKRRLHVDVSRMGRNKRLEFLKNILKRGRQEEGLENRMVEPS